MLVVALILVVVAAILFAVDALWGAENRPAPARSLHSFASAFFASGIAAWLIDILHSQGKL